MDELGPLHSKRAYLKGALSGKGALDNKMVLKGAHSEGTAYWKEGGSSVESLEYVSLKEGKILRRVLCIPQ